MKNLNATPYVKTYFRISCGYVWGEGINEEKYEFFKSEVENIFNSLGFDIIPCRSSSGCDSAVRGKESLYLHPMDFSGYILKTTIPSIEKAIQDSRLSLVCVDVFETVYDADEEFILEKLRAAKNEIRKEIFEEHRTNRKSKFVINGAYTNLVTVHLLDNALTNKIYREFITDLKEEMVKEKLLIKAVDYPGYYRSLNKTELKAWERTNGKAFPEKKTDLSSLEEENNLFSLAGTC